ncbi:MAG: glutaredoxin family protein [Halobacteriota archaeon]
MIKKQIGLLAIIAFIVTFMAFSGVASAQTNSAQVTFYTSPFCSACKAAEPIVQGEAAKYGVPVNVIDVTANPGQGQATAAGVTETPTIIVQGAQGARFEGSVTQAQMDSALQAAIGTTPAAKATVAATTTPKATVAATTTPKATVLPTTPKVIPTVIPTAQPKIVVTTTTPTTKASTQTVPEFSLLGLGAPALLVGAIYLFLRRR